MAEARTKDAANRRADGPTGALDALAESVESGAGLPETARCAAAALQASVALIDSRGAVLAVASASPADERDLLSKKDGVTAIDLRVSEAVVGQLRFRVRDDVPEPAVLRLVTTLLALEVERTRAPERAGEAAVGSFVNAVLDGDIEDRRDLVARGKEMGVDLEHGGSVLAVRIHPVAPAEGDWQARALTIVGRGARGVAPGALAALRGEQIAVIVPSPDEGLGRRTAQAVLRTVDDGMPGFAVVVGRSRISVDPLDMHRAAGEALLAANVASPDHHEPESRMLSFEDTGAYRLLLPAMSDDPAELERFYLDTIAPLVAYDEQYGTELVHTLEAFLANDGSMAATYKQLFTHRHTIRYRLERIKELAGLDVNSTDGRERLGLGLKAMRVLGVRAPSAPVFEPGAERGRVPKPQADVGNSRRR
ncbi:MAG TPA: helix-turn-helix domain-containing protein [Solirubrobacterales bacterium]|nr:helix-turn-helix domain-containing protein [Solirubrobacterales bacterium]